MDVKIIHDIKALRKGMEWNNIPEFAVLTGVNGCGKSQLLEYIKQNISNNTIIRGFTCKSSQVGYMSDIINLSIQKNQESDHLAMLLQSLDQIKKGNTQTAYFNEIKEIANELGKPVTDLEEFEIVSLRPGVLDTPEKIKRYFAQAESSRQDKIVYANDNATDEKIDRHTEKRSDEKINFLLEKYNSEYRMEPIHFPKPISPKNLSFDIFFKNTRNGKIIPFQGLSTGEKSLIQIFIAAHNPNTGESLKLFLLDEMDRYLHPSSCKDFLEVLKEIFVKQYNIKVILVTHSLATIAYTPEESLFLMDKDTQEIKRTSRAEAMSYISEETLLFESGARIINNFIERKENIILLTEGKTDKKHIITAKNKLNFSKNFYVIEVNCATKLRDFIKSIPPFLCKDKIFIGIFDSDLDGLIAFKGFGNEMDKNENIRKSKDNLPVYAICIPPPSDEFKKYKNCPIEFLYRRKILEQFNLLDGKISLQDANSPRGEGAYNKSEYDNANGLWFYKLTKDNWKKLHFSEKLSELPKEEFKNFHLLFDLIKEIIKTSKEVEAITSVSEENV